MFRSALAGALAVSLALPAQAGDRRGEAKAHYEAAKREFEEGKYDEAAKDFDEAYQIVGEVAILYNVAQAYRSGRRYEKAGEAYRALLARTGKEVANRAEIEGRIAEMDERAADERRRAERARQEAASPHKHPDFASSNTSVDDNGTPKSGGEQPVPAGQPGWVLEVVGYSLLGLAGASLVTGIVMSVEATNESHSVQNASKQSPHVQWDGGLQSDQHKGKIFDVVGISMYVLAGASVVGAGVTIALGKRMDKDWQAEHAMRIVPYVGPGGGGVMLGGRF